MEINICPCCGKPKRPNFSGHRYGLQALKPALEFVAVAQKPYAGRSVDSIVTHGAGALWIDGARISNPTGESAGGGWGYAGRSEQSTYNVGWKDANGHFEGTQQHPRGRWPANFCISHLSLPILRLQSQLPPDTQDAIRRYYAGYTGVSALRAGRNGAMHDALDVLARDVPEGWLDYFELTGEDLGACAWGRGRYGGQIAAMTAVAALMDSSMEVMVAQRIHQTTPTPMAMRPWLNFGVRLDALYFRLINKLVTIKSMGGARPRTANLPLDR